MVRADDPDWEEKVARLKIKWAAESKRAKEEQEKHAWEHPSRWKTTQIEPVGTANEHGWYPAFIMTKPAKTDIDRVEELLRRAVSPQELELTADQREQLSAMLRKAAEQIAPNWKAPTDDWFSL